MEITVSQPGIHQISSLKIESVLFIQNGQAKSFPIFFYCLFLNALKNNISPTHKQLDAIIPKESFIPSQSWKMLATRSLSISFYSSVFISPRSRFSSSSKLISLLLGSNDPVTT
jgi:hypothetical protein